MFLQLYDKKKKKRTVTYCKMLDFLDFSFSHIFLNLFLSYFLKKLSVLCYALNFPKNKTTIAFEITDDRC